MSYDQKYSEWVENLIKIEVARTGELTKVYKVYQGIPIILTRIKDNPPQYQYISPLARSDDLTKLQEKIDERTRKTNTPSKSKRNVAEQDSATYFQKWQVCQIELDDLKRREAETLARLEELQAKADQLSSEQIRLRKEAMDLRSQLEASEAIIKDLQKNR